MPTITPWIASASSNTYANAGPLTNATRLEVHTYTSSALANNYFYFMLY